jgi:hypothetical protein
MSELPTESQQEKEKAQTSAVMRAYCRPMLVLFVSPIAIYLSGSALVPAWDQPSDTIFHPNRLESIAQ